MVHKDLLIHKSRMLLSEFLAPMLERVDRPRKRFLHQAVRGILFSGSLVVMELGRWVRDDCSDPFYRLKRLLNHLVSPRADRVIVTSQGTRMVLRDFVEHLYQQGACQLYDRRVVFDRVYLPSHPARPLYVVAAWRVGEEGPLIVLTNLVVETLDQARGVLRYYKQRWACEEAAEFLKQRVGLEGFRVRCYEAIRRLALLAMFAMGFLTWILLRSRDLTRRLFAWTSRFRRPRSCLYYRLLDGLQEFVRLHPLALTTIPPYP